MDLDVGHATQHLAHTRGRLQHLGRLFHLSPDVFDRSLPVLLLFVLDEGQSAGFVIEDHVAASTVIDSDLVVAQVLLAGGGLAPVGIGRNQGQIVGRSGAEAGEGEGDCEKAGS